jgi:hypothetical protein
MEIKSLFIKGAYIFSQSADRMEAVKNGSQGVPMPNLFDYLLWRGDLSFAAAPFNEVDNLILAMLSFIEYRNIVPS